MAKKGIPKELGKLVKEVQDLNKDVIEEAKEIPITKREGYWDFPLSVDV
jgi:hypothetical protein